MKHHRRSAERSFYQNERWFLLPRLHRKHGARKRGDVHVPGLVDPFGEPPAVGGAPVAIAIDGVAQPLAVLESMTPAERVAFILHDVFGYPFTEVAEITGRSPAECRQLASTARRRVRAAHPSATPAARQASIVRDFKQAWEARDIGALIGLLDPAATLTGDGGGVANAALHPAEGGEQVARRLTDLARIAPGNAMLLERTVNDQPGLVAQQDGVTVAVFAFDIVGDQIKHIWTVLDPEKLRCWANG
jgi:hypothetical protein